MNFDKFLKFVRSQGLTADAIADDSPWLKQSYDFATAVVAPAVMALSEVLSSRAFNNLGMHDLIMNAVDVAGKNTFSELRRNNGGTSFKSGVLQSYGSGETKGSVQLTSIMSRLGLADIQLTSTRWGVAYLEVVTRLGNVWVCV
jgi:hypothetical protein